MAKRMQYGHPVKVSKRASQCISYFPDDPSSVKVFTPKTKMDDKEQIVQDADGNWMVRVQR
jgi:hypothetical protein